MYVEFLNSITDRGHVIPLAEVQDVYRDHECYISLFPFDESIIQHINVNGTIKEHKGKHFCPYLLFDIDCEDNLTQSRASSVELITHLVNEYQINPDHLWIWFSGNKGFHIALPQKMIGIIEPSATIGAQIKNAATYLAGDIPHVDTKIYENHRVIRLPNSKHAKSGLFKTQITFDELRYFEIGEIQEIASQKRKFEPKSNLSNVPLNEKLQRDICSHLIVETVSREFIQEGFFTPPQPGNRNNQLFKQATMLYEHSDLPEKSINEILGTINAASQEPLPYYEIDNIVRSAKRARRSEEESVDDLKLSTLADLIPEYVDNLEDEDHKIGLCFKSLDKEFKGKLRGKLGVVIGYGGSKKSMLGQNVTYQNILDGNRCVYSNMEMGEEELIERFINISLKGIAHMASDEIAFAHNQGDINAVELLNKDLVPKFRII